MLFLVSGPIGNLSDITLRALEVLRSVDLILCEDTRHSSRLLSRHGITTRCLSLHKFNEQSRSDGVIRRLQEGFDIALISDAGTPGISDPGEILVQACISAGISVTSVPGPCAIIAALCCSGLPTVPFQFCGFLPRKEGALKAALLRMLTYQGTSVCYESPHRIRESLKILSDLAPERSGVIGRELTKIHETIYRGTYRDLYAQCTEEMVKGECVLLIAGEEKKPSEEMLSLSPAEHVALIEATYGIDKREAIKMAAEQRGISKRTVYAACLPPSPT